jgi:thioredoxin reductase
MEMSYDIVIVGGGPAGLSAALALGRARKRVLLCDAGPRRNAAAVHVHNFVTRDGVTPNDFRRIAREELGHYPKVEVRDASIEAIDGERGAFQVALANEKVSARRVLLATGMIDELPTLEGFRELWGKSIFQCPYCHGWEVQDRRFAVLAYQPELLEFALLVRGWTSSVTVLTDGRYDVLPEAAARLAGARIQLEARPIERLVARDGALESIELRGGDAITCDVLFAHPPQRQVDIVRSLGVALDENGYVKVDPMTRETSVAGIYAGGDLLTRMQGAIMAAALGTQAAAMLNHSLTAELAVSGVL